LTVDYSSFHFKHLKPVLIFDGGTQILWQLLHY